MHSNVIYHDFGSFNEKPRSENLFFVGFAMGMGFMIAISIAMLAAFAAGLIL